MSLNGAPRRVSPRAQAAPPALAERLVARALGRTACAESVLGDLHEEYARVAATRRRGAVLWYWLQAVRLAARFAATRCANQLTRRTPPAPANPHGDSMMQTILLEARHALRALRKRPLPTAIVLLTLSLCLGANAAVFAVIDALVIRPFHFPDVDRIAFVYQTNPRDTFRRETVSPANLLDWRRQATTIEQLTGLVYWDVNLVGRDEPERVQGFLVSPDFFAVMGVHPAPGRGFTSSEETTGNHHRVVLGHGLWQRRFGADPSILGAPVDINGSLMRSSASPRGASTSRWVRSSGCRSRWMRIRPPSGTGAS